MEKFLLERKYAFEYIEDMLNSSRVSSSVLDDSQYHHNSGYDVAPSICEHGILSLTDLNKLGITNYSDDILKVYDDIDSHINGIDSVSLSLVGLTDLYPGESEYSPYVPHYVDFIVSNRVKAYRSSTHYGNEFIHRGSINKDMLRSVDIRLSNLIELYNKKNITDDEVENIIKKYNLLRDIALAIEMNNLDISMREMSDKNGFSMDIDKIKNVPKLVLKK